MPRRHRPHGQERRGHAIRELLVVAPWKASSRDEGPKGYHANPAAPERWRLRASSRVPDFFPRLPIMPRSKSSATWLREHFADPFVKKAQAEGMRSRAAYKLEELLARDRLLKPGMIVVDLGAAPGGWSQVARRMLGSNGTVIALDILPMPPIAGVDFIHGDFREADALSQLEAMLAGRPVDLVLSDMAPNMSGMDTVDLPRSMYLAELARDFADTHLKPEGGVLFKLFMGEGFDEYVRELKQRYLRVVMRKPEASRKRSPEIYALAVGKKTRL